MADTPYPETKTCTTCKRTKPLSEFYKNCAHRTGYHTKCKVCVKTVKDKSPERAIWSGMKQRCCNPHNKSFVYYGARGLSVCSRWACSYENFLADMGHRPSPKHSLERRDNACGYSPDNCLWATREEQMNNRRSNVIVTAMGETHTLSQWSRITGIKVITLWQRLKLWSWSAERALSEPPLNVGPSHQRLISYEGETHTVAQWGRRCGLKCDTLNKRLKDGWSIHDALFRPLRTVCRGAPLKVANGR